MNIRTRLAATLLSPSSSSSSSSSGATMETESLMVKRSRLLSTLPARRNSVWSPARPEGMTKVSSSSSTPAGVITSSPSTTSRSSRLTPSPSFSKRTLTVLPAGPEDGLIDVVLSVADVSPPPPPPLSSSLLLPPPPPPRQPVSMTASSTSQSPRHNCPGAPPEYALCTMFSSRTVPQRDTAVRLPYRGLNFCVILHRPMLSTKNRHFKPALCC